jgi:hypothetical protein
LKRNACFWSDTISVISLALRNKKLASTDKTAMPTKAFKPYGSPPRFDLDEYNDSFELWHQQWKIFLVLSTIDSVLEDG